jgi:hypothetical protein
MNLIPVKEIPLSTSDAYILKIFKNLIVTNDELGLCIYDLDFKLLKKISWPRDLGAYMIYQSFSENKLLLDCSDDGFLLYVNLDNDETVEIPMCHNFEKPRFLGFLYHWFESFIIFKSFAGYIGVDLKQRAVRLMDERDAQSYSYFYEFCQKANDFFAPRDMPGPFQFIYLVNGENKIGYYDYSNKENYVISNDAIIDHAIAYSNKNFVFINARQFRVVSVEEAVCIVLGKKHQEFLIAQFQDDGEYLIVLNFQFVAGKRIEFLTKYQITRKSNKHNLQENILL